jgi:hypothetical protein
MHPGGRRPEFQGIGGMGSGSGNSGRSRQQNQNDSPHNSPFDLAEVSLRR